MFKVQIESDCAFGHVSSTMIPEVKRILEERHGVNDFEDLWTITELEICDSNPNFIEVNTWVNNGNPEDRLYLTSFIVSAMELDALLAAAKVLRQGFDGPVSP